MEPVINYLNAATVLQRTPNSEVDDLFWLDTAFTNRGVQAAAAAAAATNPVNGSQFRIQGLRTIYSDRDRIVFDQHDEVREVAFFVQPRASGHPFYKTSGVFREFKPAYIKLTDSFGRKDFINGTKPGTLGPAYADQSSSQERLDATAALASLRQYNGIWRRINLMAFQAVAYGKVRYHGDGYPDLTVDLGRNPNLSYQLTGADTWDNTATANPIGDIETLRPIMRRSKRGGGQIRYLFLGVDAWAALRKFPEVKEQINTFNRGSQATLNLGLLNDNEVSYQGNLSSDLEIYVISGYYEIRNDDGTVTSYPIMDSRDAILFGDNFKGYVGFGVIDWDGAPELSDTFSVSWTERGRRVVESHCAPCVFALNPDCSARIRVIN